MIAVFPGLVTNTYIMTALQNNLLGVYADGKIDDYILSVFYNNKSARKQTYKDRFQLHSE